MLEVSRMASGSEGKHDNDWGTVTARRTFIVTMIGTALFVGAVFLFIL